jgi:hypothetical protein
LSTRRSRIIGVLLSSAIIGAAAISGPSAASADPVSDLLDQVNNTVNGLLGQNGDTGQPASDAASHGTVSHATASPVEVAGQPPNYTPPAHGSNPHAQGTGATVDLSPNDSLPEPYDPTGQASGEDVVLGGSRGAQQNGDYHGHVTILALLGNELIQGADTGEGASSTGPIGDINAILNNVCTSSGICLSALQVASNTTDTSSNNSFSVASANINPGGALPLVNLGAVQSSGNISQTGGCQTSTATSNVANANLVGISANVIDSSSESRACRNGTTSQSNDSSVLGLADAGVPLPAPGCDNGTPNTVVNLEPILGIVCNAANDSNSGGVQLQAPYGVREGLTTFVLASLVKATTAASESRAHAPAGSDNGNDNGGHHGGNNGGNNNGGNNGGNGNSNHDFDGDGVLNGPDHCPTIPGPASNAGCPIDTDGDGIPDVSDACPTVPGPEFNDGCPLGGPAGAGGPSGKGPSNLAFTGSDVVTLGLIGIGVSCAGLALMALADRRRRAVRA